MAREAVGDFSRRHVKGVLASEVAEELSDMILVDFEKREVSPDNHLYKDLLFSLLVNCIMCRRFISKDVKIHIEKEVHQDKNQKLVEDHK